MAKERKELHRELDAADLLEETGLLFEINRIVLHPLGYHLGAPEVDGKRVLRVVDYEHVEGGIVFSSPEWREGKEKLAAFNRQRHVVRRVSARQRIFGKIIQDGRHGPSRGKDPGVSRPSTP